jgi:hypothetical protein
MSVLSLASFACLLASPTAPVQESNLQTLFDQNRFFELKDVLAETPVSGPEASFFQGVVDNRFGAFASAEAALSKYLEQTGPLPHRQDAVLTMADCAVKQYQYKKAAGLYEQVIADFGEKLSLEDAEDYRNVGGMWQALADAPPQTVTIEGDSKVTSASGVLRQWPVEIGGKTQGMLLDTGANFSVIRKSLAESFGFKLVQSKVMVTGITGVKTPAVLGISPEMKFGSATIKNAVFLVFEDAALNVGGGVQLDGLIGYPIISALGRVTFTKGGELLISTTAPGSGKPNLCIDGFSMLVEGKREEQRLVFQLDTGASRTAFYPSFLAKFSDWVKKDGKEATDRFGGVGGVKSVPSYQMESLSMDIGGKHVTLANALIHKEFSADRSKEIDGNLGVDLIRQFDGMTLDFRSMQMMFE